MMRSLDPEDLRRLMQRMGGSAQPASH